MYITLEEGGSRPPTAAEAAQIRKALGVPEHERYVYGTENSGTSLKFEHQTVFIDASGGNVILTLPAISASEMVELVFKRVDQSESSTVIISMAGAQTDLEGVNSKVIEPRGGFTLKNTDTQWWVVNELCCDTGGGSGSSSGGGSGSGSGSVGNSGP